MEQAKGLDGNNVLTVIMQEKHVDLQTASDQVGERFQILMNKFVEGKEKIPSWGPAVDASVAAYVQAMEHWVIGNLVWSFKTPRYFGSQHDQVKRTRVVSLRPRSYEDA